MMKKYIPHAYQEYCKNQIIEKPYIGLFLDMGLGKTVITLTALHELKYLRWSIRKALVIAPKKVAEATWSNEQAAWEHLSNLRVVTVLGPEKRRIEALQRDSDVYVINRENVQWLVSYYGHKWPFDVVVIDESSSFKNHTTKRFKALKSVRPKIKRLIELTGTPAPHGLMDLWAQVYLLDGGARLGRTISVYRELFFFKNDWEFDYTLRDGASETIHNLISDICISMSAEDYLTLPDCVFDDIPVKLDSAAQKAYNKLEEEALLEISEDEVITAGSAGVLTNKLLQLCNGAVYDENHCVQVIHDCKIEAFIETVDQLNGEHALVFYGFQHDKDRIVKALDGKGLHVRVYESERDEIDWNNGSIDILLAHPASCAYGLNLQRGGHHVIWFGLTWSLEQYQQANKRLHRQGQSCPVIIHHLIVQGGVDEDVIKALNDKEETQGSLLRALKVRLDKAKGVI